MAHSRENKGTQKTGKARLHRGPATRGFAKGERGIALVVALVMLTLLSILGAMSLYTSSTELRIAGNYRLSQDAFFVAEAAVEYAYVDPVIYMAILPDSGASESWPRAGAGVACINPPLYDPDYNCMLFDSFNGQNPALMRISWEACGYLPSGGGASHEAALGTDKPKGNYFLINILGTTGSQTGGVGSNAFATRIAIETLHARAAAKCPDDY